MDDIDDFTQRYLAVWQELDDEARRRQVRALWAPDALHVLDTREVQGVDAIQTRVDDAHRVLVVEKGFAFSLEGTPAAHHDAAVFDIAMAPAAGGDVAWTARIVVLFDGAGRVRQDYHFGRWVAS